MIIKIYSPTGNVRDVDITDAQTGAKIDGCIDRVVLSADEHHISAEIRAVQCSLDLLAHVSGVTLNEDFYDIPIDKNTHRFEIVNETEHEMTLRIIRI